MSFTGDLKLWFGDFGKEYGRYAITLAPIGWLSPSTGMITVVPADFVCDGATVPRILWALLPPWGDISTRAAVLHDYIGGLLDDGIPEFGFDTRAKCDREFRLALIDLGVNPVKAWLAWAGVRLYSIFTGRG